MVRLFVGFEIFKTISQGKNQTTTMFYCQRKKNNFIGEAVTPENLTKNIPA